MRTYKTWEVIKMLTENPNLRFKAMPYSEAKTFFDEVCLVNGVLCWGGNKAYPLQIAIGKYDIDWQLVEIPVTWQKALEAAMIDGREVRCECKECYAALDAASSCIFPKDGHICISAIKSGKWFIIPEEVDE